MDVTRLSLARVLDLGVTITWREASAVLVEAVDRAGQLGGTNPRPVPPASVLLTRGGDVVLTEQAERADGDAVAALATDLLRGCDDPGDLGIALRSGQLRPFLELVAHDTTWKRRRAQIATLALRALAAQADQMVAGEAVAPDAGPQPARRQYVRRSSRSRAIDPPPPPPRPPAAPPAPPTRRVSARAVIFVAIAISAGAAGMGLWRASSARPRPGSPVSQRAPGFLVPVVAAEPAPTPPRPSAPPRPEAADRAQD
jgi:hypothetical protein